MALKHLPPTYLSANADFEYTCYYVALPPGVTFEDLFSPVFWAHHQKTLKARDLVRVRGHDGKFDITLSVDSVPQGGVIMKLWPRYPEGCDEAAARAANTAAEVARTKTVPLANDGYPTVRVEYKTATNWRVLGLNGEEVSRDHATEGDAARVMQKYLRDCGLTLPGQEDIDAAQSKLAEEARVKKGAGKSKAA